MTRTPQRLIEEAAEGVAARKVEVRAKHYPMSDQQMAAQIQNEKAAAQQSLQQEWKMTKRADRGVLRKVLKGLLVLLLVISTGCVWFVPGPIVDQTLEETAIHDGHLADWPNLTPEQRRLTYQDSADGWWAQRRNLTGDEPPTDVKERLDARAEALGDD